MVWTVPAVAEASGTPQAAMTSWPWWVWPLRPAPKREAAPPNVCVPRTGNTPAAAPGATGTGAGAWTASLRPGDRRRRSRAENVPVTALPGTRMRKLAKLWLLTRARRSSARPRPPCNTASRTAPRRRPRTSTRLPAWTFRRARTGRCSATSTPPARARSAATGRARPCRRGCPARRSRRRPPTGPAPGPRWWTSGPRGRAGRGCRRARRGNGRVDVAEPGARDQQQAAAAGLAVDAAGDALHAADAGLGGVRRRAGGQDGREHDQGCGKRAGHSRAHRLPVASPGSRLTLPRHASGTKVAESLRRRSSNRRPATGPGPGLVQLGRDAILLGLGGLGRVGALAAVGLPGGLRELVLAAVPAVAGDRGDVAAGLALGDLGQHGRDLGRGLRFFLAPLRVTALLLKAGSDIARRVAGPTMPSASRPLRFWKRLTALAVPGPKLPSALRPSLRCTAATALPRRPS